MMRWIPITLSIGLVTALAIEVSAETIRGNYIEARTCDVYTGPCFANAEFGLTGDQAVMAWKVESGSWQGVDISGLAVVGAVKAGSTLGDEFTNPYPAKSVLILDEKANSEQKAALVGFAKEQGGRLFENVVKVESAPIELEVGCCEHKGRAKLVADKMAAIQTRCPNDKDHICGNEAVYSGTKGAVIAFTKAIARETARFVTNVNCVCAGPTDTPLLASIPEKQREALIRAIPFRRFGKPEEVADAVIFFAGSGSDYVTGQVLSVSGGLTMAD